MQTSSCNSSSLPLPIINHSGFKEMEHEDPLAKNQKYDCLLFDLDDTLYPLSSGLAVAILKNLKAYMVEKLGIDPSKTDDLCNLLYKNYGTTLSGLRAIGYEFDLDEYHSFIHGRLPYENLKPDPVLRNMLKSLPYRKLIFTNADKVHALKTLNILGLEDCFEGIICFETLNPINKSSATDGEDDIEFAGSASTTKPATSNRARNSRIFDIISHFAQENPTGNLPKTPVVCKPSEKAIELALKIANINPHKTLFFEDSVRNVQAGKRLGLDTVLVGKSQKVQGADYILESIHNLTEAVPDLWEADVKSEVVYTENLVKETTVTA